MARLTSRVAVAFAVISAALLSPARPSALLSVANAQEVAIDPEAAIARLFGEGPVEANWFAPSFLAAVPASQVDAIVEGLTTDFGVFVEAHLSGAQGTGGAEGTVRLERGLVPVSVTLDGGGRIAGLLFRPPDLIGANVGDIAERIATIAAGEVAILVTERSEPGQGGGNAAWHDRLALRADEPMAVGSAFKLVVLRAYEDAVAAGAVRREDVVALTEADRSLPSGVLQTLRPGTPVTLDSLAGLMIQHSDNTATDALMRVLGREVLEVISPRNRPFPTTAELFKLIAVGGEARRAAYVEGDEKERRTALSGLGQVALPDVTNVVPRPTWGDVEWYVTARELCDLLVSLRTAPALNGAPEPLLASLARDGWPWIGFKGGSEFGVLNVSAAGRAPDGRIVCAVATANGGEAQPEDRLALLFSALFRSLGERAE